MDLNVSTDDVKAGVEAVTQSPIPQSLAVAAAFDAVSMYLITHNPVETVSNDLKEFVHAVSEIALRLNEGLETVALAKELGVDPQDLAAATSDPDALGRIFETLLT